MTKFDMWKFTLVMVGLLITLLTPLAVAAGASIVEYGIIMAVLLIGIIVIQIVDIRKSYRASMSEEQDKRWRALLRRRHYLRTFDTLNRCALRHFRELNERRDELAREAFAAWNALPLPDWDPESRWTWEDEEEAYPRYPTV